MGILRRAKLREKELPPQLETALKIQAELINPSEVIAEKEELKSYHINQRNETIDLDGLSGALMAQRNLQMETFIKEPTKVGFDGYAGAVTGNVSSTLGTNCGMSTGRSGVLEPVFPVLMDQGGERMDIEDNKVGTLRASMGGNLPVVLASTKPNAEIAEDLSPTLTASGGGGGGNIPLLFDSHSQDARYEGPLPTSPTLTASLGTGGNNGPIIKQQSYCIAANTINREPQNGGNGLGVQEDISYTLTTSDIPAVATFEPYQQVVGALMHRDHKGVNTCYINQDKLLITPYQDKVGAICATDDKGPNNQYVSSDKCITQPQVFGQSSYGGYGDEVSTLTASGGYLGGGSENLSVSRNLVRRLTPLECERLQGFPDNWTNIPKAADSPRYKALGNSVSLPVVEFVMKGLAYFLNKQYENEVK